MKGAKITLRIMDFMLFKKIGDQQLFAGRAEDH